MKAFLAGALGLTLLQVALSSPLTAPRLGQLGTQLSHAVARFVDPTVPLLGSSAATSSSTPAQSPGPLPNQTNPQTGLVGQAPQSANAATSPAALAGTYSMPATYYA